MARTKGSTTTKRTTSPSETGLEAALVDFKKRCLPKLTDEDQKSCATELIAQIEALISDNREPLTALQDLAGTCSASSALRHILFAYPVSTCALLSALIAHLWVVIYASCFPRLNFESQWLSDKVEEGSACDKLIISMFDAFVAWFQDCEEKGAEKIKKARIDWGTHLYPTLAKMLLEGIVKLTPVCRRELCSAVGEGMTKCPEMKALWLEEKIFGLKGLGLILDHCADDVDFALGGIEMLYRLAPLKGEKTTKEQYYKAVSGKSGIGSAMSKKFVKMMSDCAPTELSSTTDALIKTFIGSGAEKAQIIHVHNLSINDEALSNAAQPFAAPDAKYNSPIHINSKNMTVTITLPVHLGGPDDQPEEEVAEWFLKTITSVTIDKPAGTRSKIQIKLKSPVTIRGADFPNSPSTSLVELEIDAGDVKKFKAALKAREVNCVTEHKDQPIALSDENFESHPKASGAPAIAPLVPTPARVYTRPEREQLMAQQAASRSTTSASGSSVQSRASRVSALSAKPARAPVTMPPPPEVPTIRHVSPIGEEPVQITKPASTRGKTAQESQASAPTSKPHSAKKVSKANPDDTQDSDLPPLTDSEHEEDLLELEEESAPATQKTASVPRKAVSKPVPKNAPKKLANKTSTQIEEPVEPLRRTSGKRKEHPDSDEEPPEEEEEAVVLPKSAPAAKRPTVTYKRKKADSPKGVTAMKGRDGKTAAQKNKRSTVDEDEADGNATDYDAAPVATRPPPAPVAKKPAAQPKTAPKAAAKPKAAPKPQPTKSLPARSTRTSRSAKEVEEEQETEEEVEEPVKKKAAPARMRGKPISRPPAATRPNQPAPSKPSSNSKSASGTRATHTSRPVAEELTSDPTEAKVREEVPYSDDEVQPTGKIGTMSQLMGLNASQDEVAQLPEIYQQPYEQQAEEEQPEELPIEEPVEHSESRTPPRSSARKQAPAAPGSAVEQLAGKLLEIFETGSATPSRSNKRVSASKSPRPPSADVAIEEPEVVRKPVSAPARQPISNNTPQRAAPRSAPPSILKSALKKPAPSPIAALAAHTEQEGDSDDGEEASEQAFENIVQQLADKLKGNKKKSASQVGEAIMDHLMQAAAAGVSQDDEDMSPQKEASSDHLFRQRFEMPNSVDNLLPVSDPTQPTMLRVPAPNDMPFRAHRPPMSASRQNEQQRFVPLTRPASARPPAPAPVRPHTQAKAQPSPAKKRRVEVCPGVDRLAKGPEMLESAQKIGQFIIQNIANNVDQTRYQSREAKLGLVNMVQEQLEIFDEQNRYMVGGTVERLDLQNRDELELLQVMDEQVNGLQILMKHCKNHHKRMEEQKKNLPDVDAIWASLTNYP